MPRCVHVRGRFCIAIGSISKVNLCQLRSDLANLFLGQLGRLLGMLCLHSAVRLPGSRPLQRSLQARPALLFSDQDIWFDHRCLGLTQALRVVVLLLKQTLRIQKCGLVAYGADAQLPFDLARGQTEQKSAIDGMMNESFSVLS